jgi:CheY-like chemotaxis protein/anti-sigma regulatory factor (Ser/Thr protein kinase)
MPHNLLELRTEASLQGVRTLREGLETVLSLTTLPQEVQHACLLGVNELACNSVRHAQPAAQFLDLLVQQQGTHLEFQLQDDGSYFAAFAERLQIAREPLGDGLMESGMGLGLIARTLPGVQLQRRQNINCYTWRLQCLANRPRLVVIDDDPLMSELLRLYLEPEYQVTCFNAADEALAALRRDPPALVISDINMPQMNGLDLRQALLEKPQTALTPFIFLTGQQDDAMQLQAQGLGVDDYLYKPIKRLELHRVVSRVLQRSRRLLAAAAQQLDAQITASLKPTVPAYAAPFHLALGCREATAGGGDFIFHRHWGGQHTLVLGDCMGHGRQAKFFVHAYQAYLHSMLQSSPAPLCPARLLQSLSEAMLADGLLGASLVTCVALQWSDNSHELQLALAGHPPPLLFGPRGCRTLHLQGTLPGLLAGVEYPQLNVRLEPKETLLLYSDGLLEGLASRAEPLNAQARLEKLLVDECARPPSELIAWLLQLGFNGDDDASALMVAAS